MLIVYEVSSVETETSQREYSDLMSYCTNSSSLHHRRSSTQSIEHCAISLLDFLWSNSIRSNSKVRTNAARINYGLRSHTCSISNRCCLHAIKTRISLLDSSTFSLIFLVNRIKWKANTDDLNKTNLGKRDGSRSVIERIADKINNSSDKLNPWTETINNK